MPVVKLSEAELLAAVRPHFVLLLERILDFNGRLGSAAQARLALLKPGQIDFGHIYCSLSIQFAVGRA